MHADENADGGENLLAGCASAFERCHAGRIAWAAVEEHDKVLDMACGDGQMLSRMNDQLRLTLCGMCETADQARCVSEMLGGADVIPGRMEDIP